MRGVLVLLQLGCLFSGAGLSSFKCWGSVASCGVVSRLTCRHSGCVYSRDVRKRGLCEGLQGLTASSLDGEWTHVGVVIYVLGVWIPPVIGQACQKRDPLSMLRRS
jgi:hypothetical protein